jgi:hypothetical protein
VVRERNECLWEGCGMGAPHAGQPHGIFVGLRFLDFEAGFLAFGHCSYVCDVRLTCRTPHTPCGPKAQPGNQKTGKRHVNLPVHNLNLPTETLRTPRRDSSKVTCIPSLYSTNPANHPARSGFETQARSFNARKFILMSILSAVGRDGPSREIGTRTRKMGGRIGQRYYVFVDALWGFVRRSIPPAVTAHTADGSVVGSLLVLMLHVGIHGYHGSGQSLFHGA